MLRRKAASVVPVVAGSALALILAGGLAQAAGQYGESAPAGQSSPSGSTMESGQANQPTTMEEPMESASSAGAMSQDTMQSGMAMDEQQAQQLLGQPVLDQQGQQVGEVAQIVRDTNTQQLSAVIKPQGEAAQASGQEVVASLDMLQPGAEGVKSDQDLASLPEFQADQFETVASLEQQQGTQTARQEPMEPGQTQMEPATPPDTSTQEQTAQPSEGMIQEESPAG